MDDIDSEYEESIGPNEQLIDNIMLEFASALSTADPAMADECYEKALEMVKKAKARGIND